MTNIELKFRDVLVDLLCCTELNLDELEPETAALIREAHDLINESLTQG